VAVLTRSSEVAFSYQLGALLRARRAVSREQRLESPASWWLQRTFMGIAAFAVLLSGLALGASAASDPDVNRTRASLLFLLGPCLWAGYFTFIQIQSASQGHPLGAGRAFLPLSRRRSALLAILERVVAPSGLFVWATGLTTWLGVAAAGESWLNAAGWLTILLFPALPLLLREIVLGIQRFLIERTSGLVAGAGRIAIVLLAVTIPFWVGRLIGTLDIGSLDFMSFPVLDTANSPATPLGVLAAPGALALLAVAIQSAPPLRFRGAQTSRRLSTPAIPAFSFRSTARADLLMARMMLVSAVRQPLYGYSFGLLIVLLGVSAVFPGAPGAGLALLTGYMNPASSLYNLYGGDARHYPLWLATGRRLDEWTRARQVFSLAHITLFGLTTGVGLLLVGYIAAEDAFAWLFALLQAVGFALLIGPAVSRFVVTPWATDVSGIVGRRSSRGWVTWVAASITGLTCFGLATALSHAGLWWANLLPIAVLAAAYLLIRPDRYQWSPDFRERLARSFR
jgi:hypothetical protein